MELADIKVGDKVEYYWYTTDRRSPRREVAFEAVVESIPDLPSGKVVVNIRLVGARFGPPHRSRRSVSPHSLRPLAPQSSSVVE